MVKKARCDPYGSRMLTLFFSNLSRVTGAFIQPCAK